MTRVVVVLGYSDGATPGLHPICAARLARAAEVAGARDIVVLSGWAREPGGRSEAALMRAAWAGQAAEVIVDEDASTTLANAVNALDDIRRVDAGEVIVVTSAWHARRAAAIFRWLLRGSGTVVSVAAPPGGVGRRARARELALWPVLPLQLARGRVGTRKGEQRFTN